MAWLRPMPYEVNVGEITTTMTTLLIEYFDATTKKFDTYETIVT